MESEDIRKVKTKYTRGKNILLEYFQMHGTGKYSKAFDDYVGTIIEAVTLNFFDVPITVKRMCQALEIAEKRKKRISIQPTPEFLSGKAAKEFLWRHPKYPKELVGSRTEQCDGWRYRIEYV